MVRTIDIVNKLFDNKILSNEEIDFIKDKWSSKMIVKDNKYHSPRCPSCNTIILYKSGHYCVQCGQKLIFDKECRYES